MESILDEDVAKGERGLPLVKLLCSHQADVSAKNNDGKDVLCLAKKNKMRRVVDFLEGM